MKYIYWKNNKHLTALTTTRTGGISKGCYRGLNLAFQLEDNFEHVLKNRELLYKDLFITSEKIVFAFQSHSDRVVKVSLLDKGKGTLSFETGVDGDALYTYESDLALAVFHADCVPVFVHVPNKHLVMIVHAGEVGTLKEITYKAIQVLIKEENIDPKHILAHIGPARTFMNYTTTLETIELVRSLGYSAGTKCSSGTYYLDTQVINLEQLIKAGVPAKNITMTSLCTVNRDDLFYSHYREKETGRMISLIKLND